MTINRTTRTRTTSRDYCSRCAASVNEVDYEAGFCTQCKFKLEDRTMSKPRGHSNAHVDQTEPHPTAPDKASIPIEGGATVYTVKDLPPLALSRDEWQEIGERMRWITATESALRDICEYPTLGKVRATGSNRVRNYTFTPAQLEQARKALGLA